MYIYQQLSSACELSINGHRTWAPALMDDRCGHQVEANVQITVIISNDSLRRPGIPAAQ